VKSYRELLTEYKSISRKISAAYIPELCQGLKEKHPDWSNQDIKNQIRVVLRTELNLPSIRNKQIKFIEPFIDNWIRAQNREQTLSYS
jgi:hypothetical protein